MKVWVLVVMLWSGETEVVQFTTETGCDVAEAWVMHRDEVAAIEPCREVAG